MAAALLVLIAGCAGSGGDSQGAIETSGPEGIPADLHVMDPKDARGVPVCDLLSDEQVLAVGLLPQTEELRDTESNTPTCSWVIEENRTDTAFVGIRLDSPNPPLPGLYLLRDGYERFEPLTVAGHPAVRADLPAERGCVLFTAIADDQLLSTAGTATTTQQPDPCERSRRMAEMVLSNLPPKS